MFINSMLAWMSAGGDRKLKQVDVVALALKKMAIAGASARAAGEVNEWVEAGCWCWWRRKRGPSLCLHICYHVGPLCWTLNPTVTLFFIFLFYFFFVFVFVLSLLINVSFYSPGQMLQAELMLQRFVAAWTYFRDAPNNKSILFFFFFFPHRV